MDKSLLNIVMLGVAFMFLFTSFHTISNIQKTVTDSIEKEYPNYHGDAYYSQAIIYIFFSIFNWAAPSVISLIGAKFSMCLGGITYVAFISQFFVPEVWALYICSGFLGIGAALIWIGQGNYLTLNSSTKTITRNSGIFWVLLELSTLIGNTFVYFAFKGKIEIDKSTRTLVIATLAAVGVLGLILLFILRRPYKEQEEDEKTEEVEPLGPLQTFVGAIKLFFTPRMLLLNLTFLYTGLELGFFSGIYSSCLGFTMKFENRKELVGLSGILMGFGGVTGGAIFSILGDKAEKWGRDPVMGMAFILHAVAFGVIFVNLPNNSPFSDTYDNAIITSSTDLALFCSYLLGLGDSIFNMQILSLLGTVYADNSAPAFAILKFCQAIGAVITFASAQSLLLQYQLAILFTMALVGTVCFIKVEWDIKKENSSLPIESRKASEALSSTKK